METQTVIKALAALAQESRLAIFRLLVQVGPQGLAAGKISERLSLSPATLSFHLKELSHAGLIVARHEGRFIHYSTQYATMNEVLQYLTDNCCGGKPCGPGQLAVGRCSPSDACEPVGGAGDIAENLCQSTDLRQPAAPRKPA